MIWLAFAFKGPETLLHRALERTLGLYILCQIGWRGEVGEWFLFPYVLSF